MEKTIALSIAILILLVTLSGCGQETGTGSENNSMEQSTQNENTLIGKWGMGGFSHTWLDSTDEIENIRSLSGEGWEFKEDGTFVYYIATLGNPKSAVNGVSRYAGDYRFDNGTLYFTNVSMSWTNAGFIGEPDDNSHDYEPVDDFDLAYAENSDGSLGINTSGLIDTGNETVFKTYGRIV